MISTNWSFANYLFISRSEDNDDKSFCIPLPLARESKTNCAASINFPSFLISDFLWWSAREKENHFLWNFHQRHIYSHHIYSNLKENEFFAILKWNTRSSWSWCGVPLFYCQNFQSFERFNPGLSWNTSIPRWDIGGSIWANLRLWPILGIYEPILLWCSSSNQLIKPQYEQFNKSSTAHDIHLFLRY